MILDKLGWPPPCPRCGGRQGELATSVFCLAECDRAGGYTGRPTPDHFGGVWWSYGITTLGPIKVGQRRWLYEEYIFKTKSEVHQITKEFTSPWCFLKLKIHGVMKPPNFREEKEGTFDYDVEAVEVFDQFWNTP